MKTSLQLPLVIASLLLALPGHAAEREWIPYRKLVDVIKLDKFDALPPAERDKVVLYAKLVPVNKAISPLDAGLVVVDGASRTPMPLDASGRARMVLNPQWLAHDAQIWTSLPKGEKMRMGFDLGAVLPETTQWRYAAVMGAIPQTNAAIGKVAGALSLFVPTMKSVIFKFDKPAQLTIKTAGGDKRYASDGQHRIRLKFDEDTLKENPLVEWSTRPFEAEIDD
ncbi:hypothetical protein [Massilia luteola]|uniref:hypothetical protein n=1 Tax=Massilia luteola TaxID=3081751 RepID=UPI002ACBE6BB|nr:hypothetical protein [Massilia sp. Gc5]